MYASPGPTFQIYSHATDPHKSKVNKVCVNSEVTTQSSVMNGADDHSPSASPCSTPVHESPHSPESLVESPQTPPSPLLIPPSLPRSEVQARMAADDGTSTPISLKRKREVAEDPHSTPPPAKKRLNLSLNRGRSHTHSRCSSEGTSPSPSGSSTTTTSGSQKPRSVSSTPPLSPIDAGTNSKATHWHESTSLRTNNTLLESPLGIMLEHQGRPECMATKTERMATSSPQPSTSQQALSMANTIPFNAVPLVNEGDGDMLINEDTEGEEAVKCKPPKPNFHDISSWGEGRLVYGCDIPHTRPFDKFSQGHLENYAEMVSKEGDLENYLHTVERLVNLGWFFPTAKLDEVFRLMWRCKSKHAIKKMHFFLQQDIALRTDTHMKSSHFWRKLQKCLDAIKSNRKVLIASVQLSYLLKFLIKNLDDSKLEPKESLVEQLLSSKKTLNITNILDATFSHQERDVSPTVGVQCPIQSLLTMLCLPLLTSDPSSRSELRTKLAREIAMRLDRLQPDSLQYQLITIIPSNYLKEKVLDFVLERNFRLSPQSADVTRTFADDSVSFAKIASVHLHREARHPNGSPHSLSSFLQLLTALIQAHIVSESGSQPLVSIVPSSPSQPLPNEFTTRNTRDDDQLRQNLLDLHAGVLQLTERLSQDDQHFIELTEPSTWFHLQLLSLITSAL